MGASLVLRLRDAGFRVVAIHRGRVHPPDVPAVEWRAVTSIGPCTEWLEALAGVDVVVHLAALAHQLGRKGQGRWPEFHAVNVQGTRQLAKACNESSSVQRLIFVSSVGAIRSQSDVPLSETTLCEPQDDYGRSKYLAESEVREALGKLKTDWCIIRPPLVYGPANPGNMARLMSLVARGVPLPLASVDNRRSFVALDNLVDLIVCCVGHPAAAGGTFLVSDGEDLSTPELVRRLAAAMGRRARLIPTPERLLLGAGRLAGFGTEVARLCGSLQVDMTATQERLSWTPPVRVDDALRDTAKAFLRTNSA
ncbi:MAG: NAD-dependent epimerase/dehydratase family protein [Nitrococcus sp.]|nr:NAD-dependent epimerase/dehydratase family protein [Nitrococcus sp.]